MESKNEKEDCPKNDEGLLNEEAVREKYGSTVDLHGIRKNRICMSTVQLKKIFDQIDRGFNNKFLIYCEQELIKKQGTSLDFYDVANLIQKTLNARRVSVFKEYINQNKNKKNVENPNFQNPNKINFDNLNKINQNDTLLNLAERIDDIEKRLSVLEEEFTKYCLGN